MKTRVVIMGAAGRDFHNFNTFFRHNDNYEVVAFTAAQIPNIEGRTYPASLAGPNYPRGIPVLSEDHLAKLIGDEDVDQVVFAYSDIPHQEVMHKASLVLACGADFRLMGPYTTMLESTVPVIAVCAVRTGVGKSQTSRRISKILQNHGMRTVVVRHPMPYGDLERQVCQRFAAYSDMDEQECTIEEREEYEPHIDNGAVVYAGVDYETILRAAEKEADVILWDGGNNDLPFYRPDVHIVLVDPHRPGHEVSYHPGETNLRMADIVILNKVDTAPPEHVEKTLASVKKANPLASVIRAASPLSVEDPGLIRGKRALVVEDGPTLTHGEMTYGAGVIAARRHGASELVDPRPYATGSIREVLDRYPHLEPLLPAMGYGRKQMKELEDTINATPCDVVVIGTPIDLRRLMTLKQPAVRVTYELEELDRPGLEELVLTRLEQAHRGVTSTATVQPAAAQPAAAGGARREAGAPPVYARGPVSR